MAEKKTPPIAPTANPAADQQTDPDRLTVNPAVTDSVTQVNVKVLGEAPAEAMGTIYQTISQSTGIKLENESANQGSMGQVMAAAEAAGIQKLMEQGKDDSKRPGPAKKEPD